MLILQGKKAQTDWNFGEEGRVAKDWAEVNRLFSFNDNIYNVLNGVFSGNIKLSGFVVKNACAFCFEFSDFSISVNFNWEKSILEIQYDYKFNEKGKEKKYCHFSFNISKDN